MPNTRSILLFLATATSFVTLAGCQFLGFDPFDDGVDHERVWRANSNGTYTFILDRICFCFVAGRFEVKVEDYEIQRMTNTYTGEELDAAYYPYMPTIERLFGVIRDARRSGADKVRVEYAELGYPTVVDIDWTLQGADDELYYGVISVTLPD